MDRAEQPRVSRPSDTAVLGPGRPMVGPMGTHDLRSAPASGVACERLPVRVRVIRPTDAAELERFYAALSPESRRTRFFAIASNLDHAQSVSFCTTDHDHREGLVAVVDDGPLGHVRVVGHLCLEPDGVDAAEVALAVADEFQHRGIGRRLLAAGAHWARRERIARLTATMFASNAPIHRLLAALDFPAHERSVDAGVAEITIDLTGQRIAA